MNNEEIVELGKCHCGTIVILCWMNGLTFTATNVEEFMAYYREEFPQAMVTPKLHILEDHMVPWLQRCKVWSLVLFSGPNIIRVGYKIVHVLPAITLLKKGGAILQLLHRIESSYQLLC